MAESSLSAKPVALINRLNHILETSEECDILFRLGINEKEEKVFGHRLLFQIASPVFTKLISGEWAENNYVVEILDQEPRPFKMMMRYIYTDALTLDTVETACLVYKVANKYDLPHLKKLCTDYILSTMTAENAFNILEFFELYDERELINFAIQLVIENMSNLVKTISFLKCSQKILTQIVDQHEMNITEVELYKSIIKWTFYNSRKTGNPIENYATCIKEIINNIRFLAMTPEEFVDVTENPLLLSPEEELNILMNIIKPGCEPLLKRFWPLTQRRLPKNGVEPIFTWVTPDVSSMSEAVWSYSPEFTFNEKLWQVDLYRCLNKEYGLRLKILYHERMIIDFILKVKSINGPKYDYCFVEKDYLFNDSEATFTIPWSVIENEENGYLKDNKLTIEVWMKLSDMYRVGKLKRRWSANGLLQLGS